MSRLRNLMRLQQHRQIGNTTFMLTGVQFNRKACFMFATISHAKQAMEELIQQQDISLDFVDRAELRIGKIHFTTIANLTDARYAQLWGMPIQIDHFALQLLLDEEYKSWKKFMEKEYGRAK